MNISRHTEEVVNTVTIFTIDGFEVDWWSLLDILEKLEDTDWAGSRLVIHEQDFEKFLEDHDVITVSAKGSCYRTREGYDKFVKELREQFPDEFCF